MIAPLNFSQPLSLALRQLTRAERNFVTTKILAPKTRILVTKCYTSDHVMHHTTCMGAQSAPNDANHGTHNLAISAEEVNTKAVLFTASD